MNDFRELFEGDMERYGKQKRGGGFASTCTISEKYQHVITVCLNCIIEFGSE